MSNKFLNRSSAGNEMEPRLTEKFPEATENEGDSTLVPRWLVMQLHKQGKLCLAAYTHHREFLHSHAFVDPNERSYLFPGIDDFLATISMSVS
ncbi:unnamed protein product [Clavelina lepadiformis]|uniref:Uncharacterized protein n=1 Tax=Clavelina lepadiformis TaxID=159417 RepID=A0ABP0FXA0_CLALP